VYATAHTALALAAKRRVPAAPLFGLMVAAQGSELLWIGFNYAGIEHPSVDAAGTLHLDYSPWSHSLLTGLGGGVALYLVLRYVLRRPAIATITGLTFASHIVLDLIQHEPNIQIAPGIDHPLLGLNLGAHPVIDLVVETALCLACWAYYRGGTRALAALVALNIANLPFMLAGAGGATGLSANRFILPSTVLIQILVAWAVVYALARRRTSRLATAGLRAVPSLDAVAGGAR
jgi:hypothetical protein